MARYKPHKKIINAMKESYFASKNDARRKELSKEEQIELSYLQNEIERRWFRFFADHYIADSVEAYCNIVEKAPLKKAA